ncbi:tetratricopeptide repeat protein [Carboxylicivirga sp. N1Y90]|uniref:tetratricopeptide repeat protein n=1 Tax=Carboxylicivirga fragile TaxID=3417571 RepID=UPI003D3476E1|nr:hypothetical protein [Marinilabiliaceae bacterium N1Y90]
MKNLRVLLTIILAVTLFACNPLAKLPGIQNGADAAFDLGDFEKAYQLYTEYVNLAEANQAEVSDAVYAKLAKASLETDKFGEAKTLYAKLLDKNQDDDLLLEYAQGLQKGGKLEDELALWNKYEVKDTKVMQRQLERQVALNAELGNNAEVVSLYEAAKDDELTKETTFAYVKALAEEDQSTKAKKVSKDLIKANPDYKEALEWGGKYFYELADKRYKYEMAKYNKKKNATTYAYLRRDLKKVSADFRTARGYFEKLREMEPENKSYIKYLKNCYLRLEQKDKAAQMDKLLK